MSLTDEDRRAAGRDWWPISLVWAQANELPGLPSVVCRPAGASEVAAILEIANESVLPVTTAAGRSGVCGASVPVHGGIVLDMTAMAGIDDVDDDSLLVRVQPGTFGDDLERTLRADHSLTLGHWPQSMALSTVGGWLACRSAGQYSTRYGKIEDMTAAIDVVLADGRAIALGGRAPRAATGPDLLQTFLGSEGTLGVITSATLRANPVPPAERRGAWGFANFLEGLDACRRILRRGATPAVLRLYDERESRRSFDVEGRSVLVVLDEAEPRLADAVLHIAQEECSGAEPLDVALVQRWLDHRNDVSGLGSAVEQGVVVDTCEVAASWSSLPALYEAGVAAVKAVPGSWVCSAHQSHAYRDGACLYFTFAGQRDGDADGYYRDAWSALMQATLDHGGALSHHHGIGIVRASFLRRSLGPAFDVLQSVKDALDPGGILNPGKLGLRTPFGDGVVWPAAAGSGPSESTPPAP